MYELRTCSFCRGTGLVGRVRCGECGGEGQRLEQVGPDQAVEMAEVGLGAAGRRRAMEKVELVANSIVIWPSQRGYAYGQGTVYVSPTLKNRAKVYIYRARCVTQFGPPKGDVPMARAMTLSYRRDGHYYEYQFDTLEEAVQHASKLAGVELTLPLLPKKC